MATYASRADVVLAAGGEARLLQITDFDGDGLEDSGIVTDAVDEAEAQINTYARKRFATPFDPVPESIRRLAANLAVYVLKARRDALTESDDRLQDARLDWLAMLANGKVDPGISPAPAASPHNAPSTTDRPSSKAISRENLEGFS